MTSREIADVRARVISVSSERGEVYKALLYAPEIAGQAKPMQFVNVMVRDSGDPLLRRPFSISAIDPGGGTIEITWAVVGRGTKIMSQWCPGQSVRILGPLGNGIDLAGFDSIHELILVAGGTGLAPLIPLATAALEKKTGVKLFYGAKSAKDLLDTIGLRDKGCRVYLVTEDGSEGGKGLATDLLNKHLDDVVRNGHSQNKVIAVACGPKPMLNHVKQTLRNGDIPLFVSLEERMACGYGLCKGCATRPSGPGQGYYHVCTDGPVFLADDVDLESE